MATKIVFLDEYTVNESDLGQLRSLGDYTGYESTAEDEILERCADAEIVVMNKTPFKAHTIEALPKLRLICVAATGMNNVDLEAAQKAGVSVKNAVDYSTHSVAEQTFAGVLALYKQTLYFDNFVKSGKYASSDRLFDFGRPTYELHGKKWGIVGLGNIGRRVAEIAAVFGCEVAYHSTSGKNSNSQYTRMDLDDMLRWADIVSVHAPLSRSTYHLLDAEQFKLMKPTAIVVNMARGSLINEQALADALNNDIIAGASIDVYSNEPIAKDNPILSVKDNYKLVLSPHSAWASQEALQCVVDKVAENIINYLSTK